jgi:hypothetical protein
MTTKASSSIVLTRASASQTMVTTEKIRLMFSYKTLIAHEDRLTGVIKISVTDLDGNEFGVNGATTKKALHAFLGQSWKDAVKNGQAVVVPQTELEDML